MKRRLEYKTLERIVAPRPVDRIGYIAEICRGKRVLDVGCLDETALMKCDTEHWLHGRIGTVARNVVGLDNSQHLPQEGISTGPNSHIFKSDCANIDARHAKSDAVDVVVAGEFIEHLENPLSFLRDIKTKFGGCELVVSTPNGTSFANALLGSVGREAHHHDHLMTSTYKTLNTLCARAGFADWKIIPYRFFATEMLMQSRGGKVVVVRLVELMIRAVEKLFPLRSFGYIVQIKV